MKPNKRHRVGSPAYSATIAAAGIALIAAGAWYLWFSGASDVTDDQVREMQAFEEYERQRAAS